MFGDYQNLFSNDQEVLTTAASTNLIDLGNDGSELIAMNQKGLLQVAVIATTAFTGGTSLTVTLQSDDDVAFGSATTVIVTGAIVVATLVAGYRVPFPPLPTINEQYIRLYYTITGTMSTGKFWAGLVLDAQTNV